MRSDDDILPLRFTLEATMEIDVERLEQDPTWRSLSATYNLPEEFTAALQEYLTHYVAQERILRHMPCSCGPGEIRLTQLEEGNGSHNRIRAGDGTGD